MGKTKTEANADFQTLVSLLDRLMDQYGRKIVLCLHWSVNDTTHYRLMCLPEYAGKRFGKFPPPNIRSIFGIPLLIDNDLGSGIVALSNDLRTIEAMGQLQ